jgi:hypothetical protein
MLLQSLETHSSSITHQQNSKQWWKDSEPIFHWESQKHGNCTDSVHAHLLASGFWSSVVRDSGLTVLYNIGLCFTCGLFVMLSLRNAGYGVSKCRPVECFIAYSGVRGFVLPCPICVCFFHCGFLLYPSCLNYHAFAHWTKPQLILSDND